MRSPTAAPALLLWIARFCTGSATATTACVGSALVATVLVASSAVSPAPRPVREGVDSLVTWSLRGNAVRPGVRYERTVRRVRVDGAPHLRAEVVWHDSAGAVTSRTVSDADARTLSPIRVRVRAARDSSSLDVTHGRLTGRSALAGSPEREWNDPLPAGVIAPELEDAAVAALPLRAAYEGTLDVLGAFGGVQRRVVTVLGPDTLEAAGAVRDCWVVKLASGAAADARMTLWVDRATRRVWQRRGDYGNFSWWHRVTNP